MKKVLLLAFLMLGLCACKKDEKPEEPDYFDPRIIGHWEGSYTKPNPFNPDLAIIYYVSLKVYSNRNMYYAESNNYPESKVSSYEGSIEFKINNDLTLWNQERNFGLNFDFVFIDDNTFMLGKTLMKKYP